MKLMLKLLNSQEDLTDFLVYSKASFRSHDILQWRQSLDV